MDADTGSRDYISCLPDEVLGKILSSIPTKQAASTSVLAQKWRNVFRLVHNLDFDDSLLLRAPEEGQEKRFRSFVNRTLASQCGSRVKRFSLKYHVRKDCEMVHVCRWILDVVERGILELDLRINASLDKDFLPSQLFTSKTLVKLTLGRELYLGELPSDAFLPSLNTLFVGNVFFDYEHVCDVLLSCCPVLEELSVREDLSVYSTISSPTVKRLSLDYVNSRYANSDRSLSLDLPNLVYLDYSGFAFLEYPQVDLDSLVEVKLDIHGHSMLLPDISNLVVGIRKVKILHLSRASVDVISRYVLHGLFLLPVFLNLVKLSFGSYNERGWEMLKYMIKKSPKLENLTIQDLNGYTDDVSMPLEKVKALHVLGYRRTAKELEQLKSFLQRRECLEVLQVDVAEAVVGDEIKRDITMLLGVSFSSKCKIIVKQMAHVALLT